MEQSSEPKPQDAGSTQPTTGDTPETQQPQQQPVTTSPQSTDDAVMLNTSAEIKQEAEELFLAREAIYVEEYNTELVRLQQWHNKKVQYFDAQREYLLSKLAFAQRQLKNGKSSIREIIRFFTSVLEMHKAQKEAAQKAEVFKSFLHSNTMNAPSLPYQAITDASILSIAALSQFYYDTHIDHDDVVTKTQRALSELRGFDLMRESIKQSEKQIQSAHHILKDFYAKQEDCEKRLQQYVSSVESYLWRQNQVEAFISKQRRDIFKEKVRYVHQFLEMSKAHNDFVEEAEQVSASLLEITQSRTTAIQRIIENYTSTLSSHHSSILTRLDLLKRQVQQAPIQADEYHRIGYDIIEPNNRALHELHQQHELKKKELPTTHEEEEHDDDEKKSHNNDTTKVNDEPEHHTVETPAPASPLENEQVDTVEPEEVKPASTDTQQDDEPKEVESQPETEQPDETQQGEEATHDQPKSSDEQTEASDGDDNDKPEALTESSEEVSPTTTTATTTTTTTSTATETQSDDQPQSNDQDKVESETKDQPEEKDEDDDNDAPQDTTPSTPKKSSTPKPSVGATQPNDDDNNTLTSSTPTPPILLTTETPIRIHIIPPPNYSSLMLSESNLDDSIPSSTSAFSLLSPLLQLGRDKVETPRDTEYYPKLKEIAQSLSQIEDFPSDAMVLKAAPVTRINVLSSNKDYTMVFTKNRFIHLTHTFTFQTSKTIVEIFQEQSEIELDGVHITASIDKDHPTYIQLKPESSSFFSKTITLDVKDHDEAVDWVALINSHNINHSYT